MDLSFLPPYVLAATHVVGLFAVLFCVPFLAACFLKFIVARDGLDLLLPRLTGWTVLALALLLAIALISPQQLPVVLYKLSLVIIGGILGYWMDRALFPFARPIDYEALIRARMCIRRALIVTACILGLTMGL